MHMAAPRETHLSSLPSPETSGECQGCSIKAAIEIKHKAFTSEQLTGPWALKAEVEGAMMGAILFMRLPQLLDSHRTEYPQGLRGNLPRAPASEWRYTEGTCS